MEVGPHRLVLTERGEDLILKDSEWEPVEENVRQLNSMGIVGVRSSRGYKVIEPRQFVGRMRTNSALIQIRPRSTIWFASLQRFLSSTVGKAVSSIEAQRGGDTEVEYSDLGTAMSKTLDEALRVGFPSTYKNELIETNRPRGRLMFTESVRRFFVRGIRHKVMCKKSFRHFDERLASIVCLASVLVLDSDLPMRLKHDLQLLVGLIDEGISKITIAEGKGQIAPLRTEYAEWPEVLNLIGICEAVLNGMTDLWDIDVTMANGESRFCDVDRVWESAILRAIRLAAAGRFSAEFHPYGRTSVRLLTDGGPEIDPDIVLFENGNASVVVDAKNSLATSPASSDVYQVVCYAQKLRARSGALVYVSPVGNWITDLGATEGGQRILAIGVSAIETQDGLRAAGTQIAGL